MNAYRAVDTRLVIINHNIATLLFHTLEQNLGVVSIMKAADKHCT